MFKKLISIVISPIFSDFGEFSENFAQIINFDMEGVGVATNGLNTTCSAFTCPPPHEKSLADLDRFYGFYDVSGLPTKNARNQKTARKTHLE